MTVKNTENVTRKSTAAAYGSQKKSTSEKGKAASSSGYRSSEKSGKSNVSSYRGSKAASVQKGTDERTASGRKKTQKRMSMFKEITFLTVLGICVLLFAGNFISGLSRLGDYAYFLFGHLRYIAPIIILVIVWFFLFYDIDSVLLRKFAGLMLLLFAVSGILSVAFKVTDGGLLGRLNMTLFHGWLKTIGTYIIDVLLLAVAFVLFTEISPSSFISGLMKDRAKVNAEKKLSKDAAYTIKKQQIYEKQRKRNLEREAAAMEELNAAKRTNAELEYRLKRQRESDPDGSRFTPKFGIGDTKISQATAPLNTAFYEKESVFEKNRTGFSNYSESSKNEEKKTAKKKESNEGTVPEIRVSDSFFRSEEEQEKDAAFFEKPSNKFFEDDDVFDDVFSEDDPFGLLKAEAEAENTASETEAEKDLFNLMEDTGKLPDLEEDLFEKSDHFFEDDDLFSASSKKDKVRTIVTSTGKIINREDPSETIDSIRQKNTSMNPYHTDSTEVSHIASTEKTIKPILPEASKASEASGEDAAHRPEKSSGEKEAVSSVLPEIQEPAAEYEFPPVELLKPGTGAGISRAELQKELQENADKLRDTFATFGVGVTITNVTCGPTVTRYEIQPELGVKVSKIVSLTDDIKLSMAAADIRMEAPIPGKSAIGIEIPNKVKQPVMLRDMIESEAFRHAKSMLAFGAGRNIEGDFIIADIAKMPHVLVAGSTGSGKSVCINTIVMSILYHAKPTEVKLIMVDPKVVELSVYNGIPHLLLPVVTDPKKAANALMWAVQEMEKRYVSFAEFSVRGIEGYNDLIERGAYADENGEPLQKMPHILIIVDELADLMMVAPGDVENAICRLAQKARAAGIHLVLATQRPSVDVITGLIKANIPSRIAFAVSSGVDSRTILDMTGAEKLLGKGDMLYAPAGASKPIRLQGAFVSDDEVKAVVDHISGKGNVKGGGLEANVDLNISTVSAAGGVSGSDSDVDEYFADAGRLVIEKQKASIGMLQRAFKLGFNRAARIVDQLCDAGVVGEEEGTKPRKVLMSIGEFENYLAGK